MNQKTTSKLAKTSFTFSLVPCFAFLAVWLIDQAHLLWPRIIMIILLLGWVLPMLAAFILSLCAIVFCRRHIDVLSGIGYGITGLLISIVEIVTMAYKILTFSGFD